MPWCKLHISIADFNIQSLLDAYSKEQLSKYDEIEILDEDFAPIPTSLSMIQYLADSSLATVTAKTYGNSRSSRFWEELAFVTKLTVTFTENTRSFRIFKKFRGTYLLSH
jgi:hypothetical protein